MARPRSDDRKLSFTTALRSSAYHQLQELEKRYDAAGLPFSRAELVERGLREQMAIAEAHLAKHATATALPGPALALSTPMAPLLPDDSLASLLDPAPEFLAQLQADQAALAPPTGSLPSPFRYTHEEWLEVESYDPEKAASLRQRGWVAPPGVARS